MSDSLKSKVVKWVVFVCLYRLNHRSKMVLEYWIELLGILRPQNLKNYKVTKNLLGKSILNYSENFSFLFEIRQIFKKVFQTNGPWSFCIYERIFVCLQVTYETSNFQNFPINLFYRFSMLYSKIVHVSENVWIIYINTPAQAFHH